MTLFEHAVIIDTAASVLLLVYHLHLLNRVRSRPAATTLGRNHEARGRWVSVVLKEHLELLAVQTLRNWTMAATFLASTSVVLALGALHLLTMDGVAPGSWSLAESAGRELVTPMFAKVILIAMVQFLAFFHFTQTLRNFNHAGFLVVTRDTNVEEDLLAVTVRGANHYTLGMRAYYLTIPLSFWLLGSMPFLIASLALVGMLSRIDYVRTL
jgi:uncharacterized membrane protein